MRACSLRGWNNAGRENPKGTGPSGTTLELRSAACYYIPRQVSEGINQSMLSTQPCLMLFFPFQSSEASLVHGCLVQDARWTAMWFNGSIFATLHMFAACSFDKGVRSSTRKVHCVTSSTYFVLLTCYVLILIISDFLLLCFLLHLIFLLHVIFSLYLIYLIFYILFFVSYYVLLFATFPKAQLTPDGPPRWGLWTRWGPTPGPREAKLRKKIEWHSYWNRMRNRMT